MALSEAINAVVNATEQQQRDPASFTHHCHIPDVLSRYRVEHNINKGDLALLAGITPNTLIKMEKSYRNMRVETLLNVLESLGLTLYVGPVDE
ncbi:helix-turn-helix transcriptional regulator [Alteromonas antoniana]|uniref:helix-turn-helix transcriptional regulator n=1 Tax=Alteromonas antoniana TaxID=2803813 RepID=UPI001C4789CB|nr:helix-turn-helix transcriptional regulator [Alteromonas antoniana]